MILGAGREFVDPAEALRGLVDGSRITFRFEREVISGCTRCNSYMGSILHTGSTTLMKPGPETSMAPSTGAPGNQQGLYLTALAGSATYERDGDVLRIRGTLG
jgi:hypothetical protein